MALVILGMIVTQYGATFFRIRGNAGMFLLLALSQSFGVVLAFLLIFRLTTMGMASLVWAYVAAQTVSALFVLASSKTVLSRGRVSKQEVGRSFHFAWPTAVHLVALWGISGSGRWIGAYYLPLVELAAFTLLTQLVMVVGGLSRAIFDTRLPEIASGFASPDVSKGVDLVTKTTWLAGALVLATYGGVGFLLFVLNVPIPAAYAPSLPLLLLALLASLGDVAYLRGVQILHYSKHTKTQAMATLLSGSLVVVLSFALVGGHGDVGLLFAVVGGLALQALFSNGFARYALRTPQADIVR
jgi:O-antigen/teichoic acid export membrane protein